MRAYWIDIAAVAFFAAERLVRVERVARDGEPTEA